MDFTTEEKKMIVYGLEQTYGHLVNRLDTAIEAASVGIKYEGEALRAVSSCYL